VGFRLEDVRFLVVLLGAQPTGRQPESLRHSCDTGKCGPLCRSLFLQLICYCEGDLFQFSGQVDSHLAHAFRNRECDRGKIDDPSNPCSYEEIGHFLGLVGRHGDEA